MRENSGFKRNKNDKRYNREGLMKGKALYGFFLIKICSFVNKETIVSAAVHGGQLYPSLRLPWVYKRPPFSCLV